MTREARIISGWLLLSVPTIIYGGYFLLQVLSGHHEDLHLTAFQQSMFRAGHAHAGVLLLLALIVQLFIDSIVLPKQWRITLRLSFPVAAVTISLGFFAGAIGQEIQTPTALIYILYPGVAILVTGLLALGFALIRQK